MDLISSADFAKKYNISQRRVNLLCSQCRIEGAQKIAHSWIIPANAKKPDDQRIKSGKYIKKGNKCDE